MPIPHSAGCSDEHWKKWNARKSLRETAASQSAAAQMPSSGLNYVLGKLLGSGSFGDVYQALNVSTGELLAVKRIKVSSKTAKKAADLAIFEMEVMNKVRHPHVVKFVGFSVEGAECSDDRNLNLFMEFVPGRSLDVINEELGPLPESVIRHYTRQLLSALFHCHSLGVIHRDIKGKNILVDPKGEIKLADFGSAKIVENIAAINEQSAGMSFTPLWSAPEVFHGAYNFKADIWSL